LVHQLVLQNHRQHLGRRRFSEGGAQLASDAIAVRKDAVEPRPQGVVLAGRLRIVRRIDAGFEQRRGRERGGQLEDAAPR
jgi:hypothetical protein